MTPEQDETLRQVRPGRATEASAARVEIIIGEIPAAEDPTTLLLDGALHRLDPRPVGALRDPVRGGGRWGSSSGVRPPETPERNSTPVGTRPSIEG